MKKVLLATTAITAISLAGVASAQESQMMSAAGNTLSIGGYYEFGYATFSDDVKAPPGEESQSGDESFTYGDSELYIDFETSADNGLTYGVQIDLEVVNGTSHAESGTAKNAEESSLYVGGDFGTVHFGHDDNAYGRFQTWAPTHEGATSQDDNIHYGKILRTGKVDSVVLARSSAGAGPAYEDNAKITYVSPNFAGLQVGVSVADSDQDDAEDNATSFGASYTLDLGAMISGATATFTGGSYNNNAGEPEDGTTASKKSAHQQIGVTLGAGNWTFTAGQYDGEGASDGSGGHNGAVEMSVLEYGIGYQISDALSVGASLASSETEGGTDQGFIDPRGPDGMAGTTDDVDGQAGIYAEEASGDFQSVSGSYLIAPGLKTTLAYNQSDIEATTSEATQGGESPANDSTEIVWQLEFSF
jgi:hypothetical protein